MHHWLRGMDAPACKKCRRYRDDDDSQQDNDDAYMYISVVALGLVLYCIVSRHLYIAPHGAHQSEVLSRRLKYLDCNPFVIGADAVQPKNEVRDLGLVLDRDLTMTSHITGLVRTSFAILRQLTSVSRSLTQDVIWCKV